MPPVRDELRAKAWNNLGVAHSFLGDHDETIEAYAIAEARYTSLGLIAAAAKTCANRGIELLEVGRAPEALGALWTLVSASPTLVTACGMRSAGGT